MDASSSISADVAAKLLTKLNTDDARRMIAFLSEHPDEQFDSDRLQKELGFEEHKQVAKAAYTIGEQAASLGARRPWTEAQRGYTMDGATAAAFRAASDTNAPAN